LADTNEFSSIELKKINVILHNHSIVTQQYNLEKEKSKSKDDFIKYQRDLINDLRPTWYQQIGKEIYFWAKIYIVVKILQFSLSK